MAEHYTAGRLKTLGGVEYLKALPWTKWSSGYVFSCGAARYNGTWKFNARENTLVYVADYEVMPVDISEEGKQQLRDMFLEDRYAKNAIQAKRRQKMMYEKKNLKKLNKKKKKKK